MVRVKPTEKPEAIQERDDAIAHLMRTLARKKKDAPESFRKQLRALLAHWVNRRLRRDTCIYPGIAKMADWGECTPRQARNNLRRLERLRIVCPVGYVSGGRNMATELTVSILELRRWLIVGGFNPSKQLLEKLERLEKYDVTSAEKAEINERKKAEKNPEMISARSTSIKDQPKLTASVVGFPNLTDPDTSKRGDN